MSATEILPFFCNYEILGIVNDFYIKLENYWSLSRKSRLVVGFCSVFKITCPSKLPDGSGLHSDPQFSHCKDNGEHFKIRFTSVKINFTIFLSVTCLQNNQLQRLWRVCTTFPHTQKQSRSSLYKLLVSGFHFNMKQQYSSIDYNSGMCFV